MPSTLVHIAIGGLVGAALLGDRFTPRAIAVVLVAAAIPDLDSFLTIIGGAHRSALHTFLFPGLLAVGLYWDGFIAERSWLEERFGPDARYIAAVAVASLVAGGILPDLMTNGVNSFWPLHDQFHTVNGKLLLSNQRGIVQTFVDLTPEKAASTTENTRYSTGANPKPWTDEKPDEPVERVFPLATAGWQLMLVLLSAGTVGIRTWQARWNDSLNSRQ